MHKFLNKSLDAFVIRFLCQAAKNTSAVQENGFFRHNKGPIEGPLKPLDMIVP